MNACMDDAQRWHPCRLYARYQSNAIWFNYDYPLTFWYGIRYSSIIAYIL